MLAFVPLNVTTIAKQWSVNDQPWLIEPRTDIVQETLVHAEPDITDGTLARFVQMHGPFVHYERVVQRSGHTIAETTEFSVRIPWFGWLFRLLMARFMRRRSPESQARAWWSPPTTISASEAAILGLLAAASMLAAFINTLFTQTLTYSSEEFDISSTGQGLGAAVVRWGIIISIPIAMAADRIGRRRVMIRLAYIAPVIASLGALAPNFGVLVGTQAIGRPLALTLDLLIIVTAAEEMPRNARAYAVSILAMASGLGAGVAVAALPLAGLATWGWRLVFVIALVWLLVARHLRTSLPETRRFITALENPHASKIQFDRIALIASVAFIGNLFVATASIFQNEYLKEVRGFPAWQIALFTTLTAIPASVGLILGGRIADARGRRMLAASMIPIGTALVVTSFSVGGFGMWLSAGMGSVLIALAYPAMAVYRAELFPTQRRGRAASIITASSLLGGSIGLIAGGLMIDSGLSYGNVMAILAVGPLTVGLIVLVSYPETAHRELEDINPQDRTGSET